LTITAYTAKIFASSALVSTVTFDIGNLPLWIGSVVCANICINVQYKKRPVANTTGQLNSCSSSSFCVKPQSFALVRSGSRFQFELHCWS